jgi:hypothetical protein
VIIYLIYYNKTYSPEHCIYIYFKMMILAIWLYLPSFSMLNNFQLLVSLSYTVPDNFLNIKFPHNTSWCYVASWRCFRILLSFFHRFLYAGTNTGSHKNQSIELHLWLLPFQVAGTIVTYEIVLVQVNGIHADERDSTAHSVAKRYCLWKALH